MIWVINLLIFKLDSQVELLMTAILIKQFALETIVMLQGQDS